MSHKEDHPRGGGENLDNSDKTALAIAAIGAVGAAFSHFADLGVVTVAAGIRLWLLR